MELYITNGIAMFQRISIIGLLVRLPEKLMMLVNSGISERKKILQLTGKIEYFLRYIRELFSLY